MELPITEKKWRPTWPATPPAFARACTGNWRIVSSILESIKKCGAVGVSRFFGYLGKPYLSVKTMTQSTPASPVDRLAVGYQLKIHLLGISPQISRRVLVRGDTALAELHHIFQVVMGWENWHLHSFHLWGKDYGMSCAGGTWYAEDARRVHLGDFAWQANDKFTYTYDFGDYWQHQVRVEKLLPPTAVPATPVCVSGRRACPPEEVGGPRGYDQRTLDQFSWRYESLDRLLAGEDIREDDVPTWFWTYRPEHFDKAQVNRKLAKLYQLKGNLDFLLSQGGYDYFFADVKS